MRTKFPSEVRQTAAGGRSLPVRGEHDSGERWTSTRHTSLAVTHGYFTPASHYFPSESVTRVGVGVEGLGGQGRGGGSGSGQAHSEHRFPAPSSKLPDLITPLSPRSCPPTRSAPSEGFGYSSHSDHRFPAPSQGRMS